MSNYKFEDGEYLVVLSDDTDVFDCHSCNSMDEVYEVLSNRIMDELEYLFHQDMSYEDALENGIWRPEDIDFDAFTELADIKDDIVNFVSSGKCLYIASEYNGNGKTSWSIKLLLRYFDQVWAGNGFRCRGVFVHVPSLLLRLKDFDNKKDVVCKKSSKHTTERNNPNKTVSMMFNILNRLISL